MISGETAAALQPRHDSFRELICRQLSGPPAAKYKLSPRSDVRV